MDHDSADMKRGKKWLDMENRRDVFSLTHGAFIGWITESMLGAYIGQTVPDVLDLYIFFKGTPSQFERNLVTKEVLPIIEDSLIDVGLRRLCYREIIVEDDIEAFIENGGRWIIEYKALFRKYSFREFDLEE